MPSRRKKGSGCLKLLFGVVAICVILAIVFRNPEIGTERKNESQSSAAAQTIFDVINSYELRSGPGSEHPRIVNTNASDQLDEIHYLSVDSSVTVQIIATQGEWAEIQVTQPEFLRTTHRGWLPKRVLKDGPATEKLDGWIRRTCRVYPARDKAVKPVGYLSAPSSVGVADDGSPWLRLIHGPIKSEVTNTFIENLAFEDGLYIESSNFTTELPANWHN
jgi:hypothetical protein